MDGAGERWWHGATLYQVYVRSWRDTDGDGYGDLAGITAGLDHLTWLGVDGIWLSPTMPSPDQDWGYDVSDYTDVHPELGTLADLDQLIAEAGRRGMPVLLDLVPNHTSTAHTWFVQACESRQSPYRDYYVWADPPPGGGPPNNWLDPTGAPAWTLDTASGQYYLHNYLPSQADLNWWNPKVHEEFAKILKFWFDRGVAGFRIDVAHGLYKDAGLRDNPPLGDGSRQDGRFGLKSVYNANRPEVHAVYRDWRALAGKYSPPRLLLGETWVGDPARMAAFYGTGDELQLAFNFPFLFAEFTAPALAGVVEKTLAALPPGACPAWTASNHDVSRFATRWAGGDERKARLALLLLTTLPGTLVLYYGDEIAMTDVDVPAGLRRDQMTEGGLAGVGRDRARTPMRWDASPGAGFTAPGVQPWLPFGGGPDVASQRADPSSTLHLCRELLALRRASQRGQVVAYERLPAPPGAWAYRSGTCEVVANLSGEPVTVPGTAHPVLVATGPVDSVPGGGLALGPWQGAVTGPVPPGR